MALDTLLWALETHQLGRIAYYGAVEDQSLTMDYISENMPKLKLQIFKAGLRLSKLISHIFGGAKRTHFHKRGPHRLHFLQ